MGVLGSRSEWVYHSDGGNTYNIKHRDVDALATSMTVATRGANPPKPTALKPRGVWAVSGTSRRLFICGSNTDGFYTSGGTISADGLTWQITGRHGERTLGDGSTS